MSNPTARLCDRIDAWALVATEVAKQLEDETFKANEFELRELQGAFIRMALEANKAADHLHDAIMRETIAKPFREAKK